MKNKETVFIIRGCDLGHLDKEAMQNRLSFIPSINAIDIGDATTGFDHENLINMFSPHLTNEKEINIVIDAHGAAGTHPNISADPDKYYLSTKKGGDGSTLNVAVDEILPELVKATRGVPLKIFVTSCYGKYFQQEKYLEILPKGSILVTLSGNGETKLIDEHIYNEKIIESFNKSIAVEGNTIKTLLKTYCLNQKRMQYDPIIGIHKEDGSIEKFKVGSFIKKYAQNHNDENHSKFSAFFENLFAADYISRDYTLSLIKLINSAENLAIRDFKLKLPISLLIQQLETKSVSELKLDLETKFYPSGSLQSVNFDNLLKFKDALADFHKDDESSSVEALLFWFESKHQQAEVEKEQTREQWLVNGKLNNKALTTSLEKQYAKIDIYKKAIEGLIKIQSQNLEVSTSQYALLPLWALKKYEIAQIESEEVRQQWFVSDKMGNEELTNLLINKYDLEKKYDELYSITSQYNSFSNSLFNETYEILSNFNILLTLGAEAAMEYTLEALGLSPVGIDGEIA